MNLSYRNHKNALAIAQFWGKPIERPDWYKINALSEDDAEVMIYDVIGWPYNDASELVKTLNGIKAKTITVRINSPGGDVFDGTAIFNALKNHSSKVITRVEGLAASMGSVIAMAGKEVQAYKNSMLMIHNAWVLAAGNASDLRDIADILEKIDGNIVDIYNAQASCGKKKIRDMMNATTWMTADESKELGFIDTVLEAGKASAKARFDLSMFNNVPEGLISGREGGELTEREIERALRDAGGSRSFAKGIIAKLKQPLRDVEAKSVIEGLIKSINGGCKNGSGTKGNH